MSQSLVRRGLDMYKSDLLMPSTSSKADERQVDADEMADQLVGTRKKGFKRKMKRLQDKKNTATLKDKKLKPSDEVLLRHKKHDRTDDNLKALDFMRLLNKDERRIINKATEQHSAKLNKSKKRPTEQTETGTAFSEEDFEKFFKEYKFT